MDVIEKVFRNGKVRIILISELGSYIGEVRFFKDGYISMLRVTPKLRSMGYGKKLVELAMGSFYDVECMRLHVDVWNERAINFYRGIGFFIVNKTIDGRHYFMVAKLGLSL